MSYNTFMREGNSHTQIDSFDIRDKLLHRLDDQLKPEDRTSEELDVIRKELLERFPSHNEGLNIQRVEQYLTDSDIEIGTFTVILEEDLPQLEKALEEYGLPSVDDADGMAIGFLNIAFVVRSPGMEEHNGTDFFESTLVHELGHLSGMQNIAIHSYHGEGEEKKIRRMGMITIKGVSDLDQPTERLGDLLEEGFAGFLEMRYKTEVLGKPAGYGAEGTFNHGEDENGQPLIQSIDGKYVIRNGQGDWSMQYPAIAAATIEILNDYDSGIFPLMIEARRSSDALRELIKHLNAIDPRMYTRLRNASYDTEGLSSAYNYVQALIAELS